jgi:predicted anti-sigma-YlaC factor YlaD
MTCEELVSYLSAYLDQELDEDLTATVKQHLATCSNCRVVLHTTTRVIQLGQAQYLVSLPPDRRDLLYARLRLAYLSRER